jgi:undecaprenyl-diphosphatase
MAYSKRGSFLDKFSNLSCPIHIQCLLGTLFCLLSLVLLFFFTTQTFQRSFSDLDTSFSQFVYEVRSPGLTWFLKIITSFGASVTIVVATLVSIILLMKKHRKEAILFCVALIIGSFLNSGLKTWTHRTRPAGVPLVVETSYSFPSGHAMNAFIFYGLLAYFSYHFSRSKRFSVSITFFCTLMILMIGFSRVYLGVHYLTDVIAGYLAGFWWFMTVLLVQHLLIFYRVVKQSE